MSLPFPNLLGDFQISNITTAISVAMNLEKFKITESHIKKAITKIRSEGRLQMIKKGALRKFVSKNNQIIVDGAHNSLGAFAIRKYLETLNYTLNGGRHILRITHNYKLKYLSYSNTIHEFHQ